MNISKKCWSLTLWTIWRAHRKAVHKSRSYSQAIRVSSLPVGAARRSALPPLAFGPWRCGGPQSLTGGRDPALVLVWFNASVGAVWWRRCLLVGIMSPMFDPRPDGPSSVVGGHVVVCLHQISQDSVGVGLRWICLDPVFDHLRSRIYRIDPSDLRFS
jgi:hypothetical protein